MHSHGVITHGRLVYVEGGLCVGRCCRCALEFFSCHSSMGFRTRQQTRRVPIYAGGGYQFELIKLLNYGFPIRCLSLSISFRVDPTLISVRNVRLCEPCGECSDSAGASGSLATLDAQNAERYVLVLDTSTFVAMLFIRHRSMNGWMDGRQ